MFPSLVNCCIIDSFLPWPEEALRSVAALFLDDLDVEQKSKPGLVDICIDMQVRVSQLILKYQQEMRRYY